jgi:hypothetical protein
MSCHALKAGSMTVVDMHFTMQTYAVPNTGVVVHSLAFLSD